MRITPHTVINRITFKASLAEGAQILRSVWPSLPRHGEEDAWTSPDAMAAYVAAYDEVSRGPGPWVPSNYRGSDATLEVASGGRVISARRLTPAPAGPYLWVVNMEARPSRRSASLLADLLLHVGISWEWEGCPADGND